MDNVLVFITSLIILPLYFWLNYHSKSTQRTSHKDTQQFHAVSIKPCANACTQVKKLKGKSFLASKVSQIPLNGCNAKACTCRYVHYTDRRDGEERRYPSGLASGILANQDQRLTDNDRRKLSFV